MATADNSAEKKDKIVIPTKTTLNLCMKEKSVISPALFVPLLVIVLALAAVIGYFGVYKQFERVKIAQAELDEAESHLQQTLDKMSDYDDVQKRYNQYNYEGFDGTIHDSMVILDLLERQIYPVSTVRSISFNKNLITLELSGMTADDVATLVVKLGEEDIVMKSEPRTYTSEDGEERVSLRITLNDANMGGK